MKRIADLLPADRPREKLKRNGPQAVADTELLAVILGTGVAGRDVLTVARDLLKTIDQTNSKPTLRDLLAVPGLGKVKALMILAALEFSRRRLQPFGNKIKTAKDVIPLVGHLAHKKQEHFVCISINAAFELLASRVVSIGLVDRVQVHPREVFADAISDRASAIIIAHNHPAGVLQPSPADILLTKQLKRAGKVLGISLLDHVIFDQSAYYSFAENERL